MSLTTQKYTFLSRRVLYLTLIVRMSKTRCPEATLPWLSSPQPGVRPKTKGSDGSRFGGNSHPIADMICRTRHGKILISACLNMVLILSRIFSLGLHKLCPETHVHNYMVQASGGQVFRGVARADIRDDLIGVGVTSGARYPI